MSCKAKKCAPFCRQVSEWALERTTPRKASQDVHGVEVPIVRLILFHVGLYNTVVPKLGNVAFWVTLNSNYLNVWIQ